jgi:hypothetical protein
LLSNFRSGPNANVFETIAKECRSLGVIKVSTTPGRGRVDIHGALNPGTFDMPFVEPTTMDGVSAAQLLAKVEARNPDKRVIHVIWDNAAYHKEPDVRLISDQPPKDGLTAIHVLIVRSYMRVLAQA